MSAPLAVTMGEPAGIGGEILLKAWLARGERELPKFIAIDDPARLASIASQLGLAVPVEEIKTPQVAGAVFNRALPVLGNKLAVPSRLGRLDPKNASSVLQSIDQAVALACAGDVAALITSPIHKANLYSAGFHHPGHTEYLAELAGGKRAPVMMLLAPGLKVVPLTVHVPLAKVPQLVSQELIAATVHTVREALVRDFSIAEPRIAVAGLNPHAGEGGRLGREEEEIIAPAVRALVNEGLRVSGPHPADSLFHEEARRRYDAAVCMYHDQALIPLKSLDFVNGVNITLGLPFIRTSPDHGTALDIAGEGKADPRSMIAAIRTAGEMASARAVRASPQGSRSAAPEQ